MTPADGASSELVEPPFYFPSGVVGGAKIEIPCQGRTDNQQVWPGHGITRYVTSTGVRMYFDPSYGTDQGAGETDFSFRLSGFRGDSVGVAGDRYWRVDSGYLDLNFPP